MLCVVDWQAIATLSTGLAAVLAAVHVARKQNIIQIQQLEIAERIAIIERAKIRHELFNKRLSFVFALEAFIKRIKSSNEEWTDEAPEFLRESRIAELNFKTKLKQPITDIWHLSVNYQEAGLDLRKDGPERKVAQERRKTLRAELLSLTSEFEAIFEEELRPFE